MQILLEFAKNSLSWLVIISKKYPLLQYQLLKNRHATS